MREIVKGMLNSPICPPITPYLYLHPSNTSLSPTTQSTPPTIPYLQLPLIYNSLLSSSLSNFNCTPPTYHQLFPWFWKTFSFFLSFCIFFWGGDFLFIIFYLLFFFHFLFLYKPSWIPHPTPPPAIGSKSAFFSFFWWGGFFFSFLPSQPFFIFILSFTSSRCLSFFFFSPSFISLFKLQALHRSW